MSAGADGKERVCGGVLEGGEGFVLPQALRKVPGGLGIEFVVHQAASASRMEASRGPDGRETACGGVLEGSEALVGCQSPANRIRALCSDVVVVQTANGSQMDASAGLNSREWATK